MVEESQFLRLNMMSSRSPVPGHSLCRLITSSRCVRLTPKHTRARAALSECETTYFLGLSNTEASTCTGTILEERSSISALRTTSPSDSRIGGDTSVHRSSSSNHNAHTPTISAFTTGRLVGQSPPNPCQYKKDQALIVLDHRYGENILSIIRLAYM